VFIVIFIFTTDYKNKLVNQLRYKKNRRVLIVFKKKGEIPRSRFFYEKNNNRERNTYIWPKIATFFRFKYDYNEHNHLKIKLKKDIMIWGERVEK